MYVDRVPNRNSPPCILIRESYREQGKVKKRTVANISKLPKHVIAGIEALLKNGTVIEDLSDAFEIVSSQAYGHVQAVLGMARKLGIPRLLGTRSSPERNRVLAMIVARILAPRSKLATARGLDGDAHLSALREALDLHSVTVDQLYAAMDWLLGRQSKIEDELARRHLKNGSLVLYDVTSTYFEGQCCPLAKLGYSRDQKKGKLQIIFGLLCDIEGRPIAVEIFEGNTGDPKTVRPQIEKLRQRFGLERVIFVGDRGMLSSARISEEFEGVKGLDWISALRTTDIRKLAKTPGLQLSLFDERGFAEMTSDEFPGERLIACRNPILAEYRAAKREALLEVTEKELDKIVQATQRPKRRLQGEQKIALRVGRIFNKYKVAKHFHIEITDSSFTYHRRQDKIDREAALDGIYVIRTSVPKAELSAEEAIRAYKDLSAVERAFRSVKTVDLHVRPIYHFLPERVRAHVFLCMLAYYVEWHMREKLGPLLFDDEDPGIADALRISPVKPAQPSPSAREKASSKKSKDGLTIHSFRTLLDEMANLRKEIILPKVPGAKTFEKITTPSTLQSKAFRLLGVKI